MSSKVVAIIVASGYLVTRGRARALYRRELEQRVIPAVDAFIEAGVKDIVVVLPSNRDQLAEEVRKRGTTVVVNRRYVSGIAEPIRQGILAFRGQAVGKFLIYTINYEMPMVVQIKKLCYKEKLPEAASPDHKVASFPIMVIPGPGMKSVEDQLPGGLLWCG